MKYAPSGSRLSWKQQIARRLTCVVWAMQAALLLTLWVTPTWVPPRVKLFELLWAWMHRPTFYPLVVLLVGGPILTTTAWCCKGRHRLWLIVGWLVLMVLLFRFHHDRVSMMLRALWWLWIDGH